MGGSADKEHKATLKGFLKFLPSFFSLESPLRRPVRQNGGSWVVFFCQILPSFTGFIAKKGPSSPRELPLTEKSNKMAVGLVLASL